MTTPDIILIILSYLIGSIPFGIVIAKLFGGADPRSGGSGNIGATNVSRTLGKGAGFVTLLCDAFKGTLPVAYALYLHPEPSGLVISLTALAAFAGHIFPVYLRFKGGKGVSTALGVMLLISPLSIGLCVVVFIVLVALTRYISLGSICAAVSLPLALKFITRQDDFVILGVVVALLIIIKHTGNIKRLASGTENKFR